MIYSIKVEKIYKKNIGNFNFKWEWGNMGHTDTH